MLFDAATCQRCFSERLAVKKAARTIYVPALFVKNFFIMVRSMPSNRSRTSDVSHFQKFSAAQRNFLSQCACAGDCSFHDATLRMFTTQPRAAARALLQFQ